MTIDLVGEKKRLAQAMAVAELKRQYKQTDMVLVDARSRGEGREIIRRCTLVPIGSIEGFMRKPYWDFSSEDGHPGAMVYGSGEESSVSYLRYGNDDGLEPLVLHRNFHDIYPGYVEISEEFRLFHRLYHDRESNRYLKIDAAGNETVVALIGQDTVEIRLLEIRQFLAIKEMSLCLLLASSESSAATLADIGSPSSSPEQREGSLVYVHEYKDLDFGGTFQASSRVVGKRLIAPLKKEQSGFWGFAQDQPKQYLNFIVGVDEAGNPIEHSCDPLRLSNPLDSSPSVPAFLTPVFFSRQVLDKYYQRPSRYSVEDGYLRCAGLWGIQMDNHGASSVVAWLGDLGQDLPSEEQHHWRQYNMAPVEQPSPTFIRRQILAQFADSPHPELAFKRSHDRLLTLSRGFLGWELLRPLDERDLHCLASLRVPASNEQKEFDEIVLSLAKILIDSLNERELVRLLPRDAIEPDDKGITKLEKVFVARGLSDHGVHIGFLRQLQGLRSSGAAHLKGKEYENILAKSAGGPLSIAVRSLIDDGIQLLSFLEHAIRAGTFSEGSSAGFTMQRDS